MPKTKSSSLTKARRAPQRTCVACRKVMPKQALVRLVRTSGGSIELDTRGRKPGRGAYLCLQWQCWEEAQKARRLEYSLHGTVSAEDWKRLMHEAEELLRGAASGQSKQTG